MSTRTSTLDPVQIVLRPLSPAVFWGLGAGLALLFAAYCQLHGVVEAGRVPVAVSLAWGLALALPWWSAWEGCKRLGRIRAGRRGMALAALLFAALLLNVSLHYAVGAVAHPDGHAGWVELLYGRFPLALGLGGVALLLRPWAPVAARAPALPSPRAGAKAAAAEALPVAATSANAAPIALRTPALSRQGAAAAQAMPATAIQATKGAVVQVEATAPGSPTLRVPTRDGTIDLASRDLDYVRAAGNYVELTAGGHSWLLRATLQEIETKLAPAGFVRIHRSLLVNPARVSRLQRDTRKLPALRLTCGATLPVGRRYVAAVKRMAPRPH